MTAFAYLFTLLVSLAGLAYADYRYRLALFYQPKQTIRVISVSVLFFLIWDVAGITLDIFHTNPRYVSGLHLGHPDLPIEELLFLTLLTYLTLLFWRFRTR